MFKASNINDDCLTIMLDEHSGLPYHFTDPRNRQLELLRQLGNSAGGLWRRAEYQFVFLAAFEGLCDLIDSCSNLAQIANRLSNRQQLAVNYGATSTVLSYMT